jgi:hypothetical protein
VRISFAHIAFFVSVRDRDRMPGLPASSF